MHNMLTRKERTEIFNDNINIVWKKYYLKFIKDNIDEDWDWGCISENLNITIESILENPDKPWDWLFISLNENITIAFIQNNPNYDWEYSSLSCCTFAKEKEEFRNKQYRRYMASYKIQQWWKERTMSPII